MILYIHGLDGQNDIINNTSDKLKYVEKYFKDETVLCIPFDYRTNKDVWQSLCYFIDNNPITRIIGTSMGGYLGFYLSEYYRIPALLFNPALSYRSVEVSVIQRLTNTKKLIVLGKNDTIIDYKSTLGELDTYENSEIVILNDEHRISFNNFKDMIELFNNRYYSYVDLKKEYFENETSKNN